MENTLLVTGGAGFIGSAFVRDIIQRTSYSVVNVDVLTYAGNLSTVQEVQAHSRYHFEETNIADAKTINRIFAEYRPSAVVHLAAETHVDRSIDGPAAFIKTNIVGTYTLLEAARKYWQQLDHSEQQEFRFLHVSTDEVYGALGEEGYFTEETSYQPTSPYSASKASADHMARAWHHTFGLPTIVTNCSNNYGPYQYPEKLIPVVILNALEGKPIPIYGKGENVRDWLYVNDHVDALKTVLHKGKIGETYNIGGDNEIQNIEIVHQICELLNTLVDNPVVSDYASLITFVEDRPGHDFRYAIDASKIKQDLDWTPKETFPTGIEKTVRWYLSNLKWCAEVTQDAYNRERLGLIKQPA